MAKSTPEAEFDLKKRLLGALILIGLGVVVLPALLGDKEPQSKANDTQSPSAEDSKVFVSRITPIGGATPQPVPAPPQDENNDQNASVEDDASSAVNPSLIEPVVSEPSESSASKPAKPAPEPESQTKSSPEPEPESPRVKTNEPGWVVRVGTFAQQENADRVIKRLEQAGFSPSTTKVKTDKGLATRVWIGPYAQRVEAARMRTRARQVTGGEGYIAAYP